MVEKTKTDVDRLLMVLTMEINFLICFGKIELIFNFETKNSLTTPVLVFSAISQILKTIFYIL